MSIIGFVSNSKGKIFQGQILDNLSLRILKGEKGPVSCTYLFDEVHLSISLHLDALLLIKESNLSRL